MVLARILASPQFIYRIEEEPATVEPGQAYRISDLDLASRLSFFLWSTAPDDGAAERRGAGRLKDPAVLEQQVRRMLKDPKAEALAVNFAGQWLNLRGLDATAPLPLLYPDFDDPLRQAMRREVELLFDSIVREDRSILELLTADYTFVNERLAQALRHPEHLRQPVPPRHARPGHGRRAGACSARARSWRRRRSRSARRRSRAASGS